MVEFICRSISHRQPIVPPVDQICAFSHVRLVALAVERHETHVPFVVAGNLINRGNVGADDIGRAGQRRVGRDDVRRPVMPVTERRRPLDKRGVVQQSTGIRRRICRVSSIASWHKSQDNCGHKPDGVVRRACLYERLHGLIVLESERISAVPVSGSPADSDQRKHRHPFCRCLRRRERCATPFPLWPAATQTDFARPQNNNCPSSW